MHNFSSVVLLVPALQLDRLTVEDGWHDPGTNDGWGNLGRYGEVEDLLQMKGWK